MWVELIVIRQRPLIVELHLFLKSMRTDQYKVCRVHCMDFHNRHLCMDRQLRREIVELYCLLDVQLLDL